MSELDDRFVYHGFWVNHARGPIVGQTITTDTRTATIVVALLAIMSTIGATHLWNLLLFAFHQQRASGGTQDVLFWQQQALIRTLPAPGSFATETVKLWWLWRQKGGRVLLRCLIPSLVSLLFAACTLTASVFSSVIVSNSDVEVLVSSPFCGFRNATAFLDGPKKYQSSYVSTYEDIGTAYARNCYKTPDISQVGCQQPFVQPRIPVRIEQAECPFSSHMCSPENSSAVVMDSGLLDMNRHFGFNLRPNEGVQFRRRTTCTVLQTEGYIRILNISQFSAFDAQVKLDQVRYNFPTEQFEVTFYGAHQMNNGTDLIDSTSALYRATRATSLLATNVSHSYTSTGSMFLGISCPEDTYCLKSIPELSRSDADVALLTVTIGNIMYYAPVEDPLFAAHVVHNTVDRTVYDSDHRTGTIGCAIQYQVCVNTANKDASCTALGPMSKDVWQNDFPGASHVQKLMLQLLGHNSFFMDFSNVQKLNASYQTNRGYGPPLPPDQWKTEAIAQDSNVWAVMQILLADYAIGAQATEPHAFEYIKKPTSPAEKEVCHAMRMKKSGGFANINVLGLTLTIAFSCTFLIVDLFILRILLYIPRFRQRFAPRIDRWIQDGVHHFQRRAYEANGEGMWMNIEQPIPTTATLSKVSELPMILRNRLMVPNHEQFERQYTGQTSSKSTHNVDYKTLSEKDVPQR